MWTNLLRNINLVDINMIAASVNWPNIEVMKYLFSSKPVFNYYTWYAARCDCDVLFTLCFWHLIDCNNNNNKNNRHRIKKQRLLIYQSRRLFDLQIGPFVKTTPKWQKHLWKTSQKPSIHVQLDFWIDKFETILFYLQSKW